MSDAELNRAIRTRFLRIFTLVAIVVALVMASVITYQSVTASPKAAASGNGDGTKEHPFTGATDDQPAVLPSQVDSWLDVVRVGEAPATRWYQDCVTRQLNVDWTTVQRAAVYEKAGWLTQGILVSRTAAPKPEDARKLLGTMLGVKVDPRAPIIMVDGFLNTRGLETDRCNTFGDSRSQMRLTLLLPGFTKDTPQLDRGILFHCGNPWYLPAPGQPIPPTTPPGGGGGGGHKPPPPPPPTTPPTTPPKCAGSGNQFGGKTYCGTPTSGPEQQPVQDNNPAQVAPTPGYTPGNAEAPHPGTNSGGGGGSSPPGGTTNPDGSTTPGGDAGTSNPDPNANPDPGQVNPPGDPGAP